MSELVDGKVALSFWVSGVCIHAEILNTFTAGLLD